MNDSINTTYHILVLLVNYGENLIQSLYTPEGNFDKGLYAQHESYISNNLHIMININMPKFKLVAEGD